MGKLGYATEGYFAWAKWFGQHWTRVAYHEIPMRAELHARKVLPFGMSDLQIMVLPVNDTPETRPKKPPRIPKRRV